MRFVMPSLAALGLVVSLTACGGGAAHTTVAPLSASTPAASPSGDPGEAAKAAFKGYVKAVEQAVTTRSSAPLQPYATDAWASTMIDQYRKNLWAKKQTMLGASVVASATATVTAETAVIKACVDSSNVFQVPVGTKAVSAGSGATSVQVLATGS